MAGVERSTYWLGGASTVPFVTRRKVMVVTVLGVGAFTALWFVVRAQSIPATVVAFVLGGAAVAVWLRRDAEGGRWIVSGLDRVRGWLSLRARWDEFDPEVEVRPFWLERVEVASVATGDGHDLGLLDDATHLVAVLEVDGGGHAIQTAAAHARRERAFRAVLRACSRPRVAVSQLDVMTSSFPTREGDLPAVSLAQWVTPAVAQSMADVRSQALLGTQQYRSWVVVRMPVDQLAAVIREDGLAVTPDRLNQAALETVGQVTRLFMDNGIGVHRGLSSRRWAAVIRGLLLCDRSVDDTAGIRDFWHAWPAFEVDRREGAVTVFDPATGEASWHHATASVPRAGWPTAAVHGRWLAPLVLSHEVSHRVVVNSFELLSPMEASGFARDQLTTAASLRVRQRSQGKVGTGEVEVAESSAALVAKDVAVHHAAGLRVLTRVMVSGRSASELRRAQEEIETITSNEMGVTRINWDTTRPTLGVLSVLPLGRELPRDY